MTCLNCRHRGGLLFFSYDIGGSPASRSTCTHKHSIVATELIENLLSQTFFLFHHRGESDHQLILADLAFLLMVFSTKKKWKGKVESYLVLCVQSSMIDIISPYSNSFSPNEKIDLSFCDWTGLDWVH